eukprot:1007602-Amphidinium_carterae.1
MESSVLLVHANDFSCKLPRNGAVRPTSNASLALIGNHFAKPRQLPAWITRAEQPSDMFCTSNEQGKQFLMFFMCGACIFMLAAFIIMQVCSPSRISGRYGCAWSVWCETSKQQSCFFLASCLLLVLYENRVSLACPVVFDHLRFHFIANTRSRKETKRNR